MKQEPTPWHLKHHVLVVLLVNISARGAAACSACPAGFYCSSPERLPIICPVGYFSAGGTVIACAICTNGFLCPPGSIVANPPAAACPKGYYCTSTTVNGVDLFVMNACNAGSYGTTEGATTQLAACTTCPAGTYCPIKGMTVPIACPRGAYCTSGSSNIIKCASGTYNPKTGSTTSAACIACPIGNYCPVGSYEPVPCDPGYYCPINSVSVVAGNKCPQGTYSSVSPIGVSTDCINCPPGSYCPLGSGSPTFCPPGTYNQFSSKYDPNDCLSCSLGTACPKYGNIKDNGVLCAPGYYCPAGTAYPTQNPCPAGKYSDKIGATSTADCQACPAGWYCLSGTNRYTNPMIACPPGYYCLSGTDSATKYPCSAGKYQPNIKAESSADCSFDCPPGKYCPLGSASPAGLCDDGYYCPQGIYPIKTKSLPSRNLFYFNRIKRIK